MVRIRRVLGKSRFRYSPKMLQLMALEVIGQANIAFSGITPCVNMALSNSESQAGTFAQRRDDGNLDFRCSPGKIASSFQRKLVKVLPDDILHWYEEVDPHGRAEVLLPGDVPLTFVEAAIVPETIDAVLCQSLWDHIDLVFLVKDEAESLRLQKERFRTGQWPQWARSAEPPVPGLKGLLVACGAEEALSRARTFLHEQGARTLQEVVQFKFEEDFLAALQLKPIPKARVRSALHELPPTPSLQSSAPSFQNSNRPRIILDSAVQNSMPLQGHSSGLSGGTADLGRLKPQHEEVSILPSTRWEDFKTDLGLMEHLRQSPEVRMKVPEIDRVLEDVEDKVADLRFDPNARELIQQMDDDELSSLVIYTHDLQQADGRRDGNFYYEENKDLRKRAAQSRTMTLKTWGVHVCYALRALGKVPDFEGEVFRGFEDLNDITTQYQEGRRIQWGAWSSTTSDKQAAMGFAGPNGAVLKIKVFTAKDIKKLSFFSCEGEILVSPNHKFMVTSSPYVEDGYTFVNMMEVKKVSPHVS